MPWTEISLAALAGLVIGAVISYILIRRGDRLNLSSAENRAKDLLSQAERNCEYVLKDAELKVKDTFTS